MTDRLDTVEQIKRDLMVASNIVFNAASGESPVVAQAHRALSYRLDRYARYSQIKTIATSPPDATEDET